MTLVQWLWSRRFDHERGQALMEYELVLILVAVIVILILAVLGQSIQDTYQFIIDNLPI